MTQKSRAALLFHHKTFFYKMTVQPKPKQRQLFVCCVHLIICNDSRWISFSLYQLKAGRAARIHFLQHQNNLISQVCQRQIPRLNKDPSSAPYPLKTMRIEKKSLISPSSNTFTTLQFLYVTVYAPNTTDSLYDFQSSHSMLEMC